MQIFNINDRITLKKLWTEIKTKMRGTEDQWSEQPVNFTRIPRAHI